MGWPDANEAAVRRAAAVLARGGTSDSLAHARAVIEAAGLPELIGATDVAALLGTWTSNLTRWPTLPEPLYHLRSGKLWDAAVIRRFAAERAGS